MQLYPRGVLAYALSSFMEWSDLIVVWDLKRLFKVKDPEEAAKFVWIVRKEVWVDVYKGYLKFMAELKKYYKWSYIHGDEKKKILYCCLVWIVHQDLDQQSVREHIWLSPSKRCSRYKKESLEKKRRKRELNKIICCLYIVVQPSGIHVIIFLAWVLF